MVDNSRFSSREDASTQLKIAPVPEMDIYRSIIFPNNIREYRKLRSSDSLLQISQRIRSTTYIRLSKIERGEVFARADEIRDIAEILGVEVEALFIDVRDPKFDIAAWAEPFLPSDSIDLAAETMAVVLGAAMRARRARDPALTIAVLERDYGIAPVILSRIENAFKTFDRWSPEIKNALFRIFDVRDTSELEAYLAAEQANGDLAATLPLVANPEERIAKTRAKLQSLREDLAKPPLPGRRRAPRRTTPSVRELDLAEDLPIMAEMRDALYGAAPAPAPVRMLPIYGAPLTDGLLAEQPTGDQIEAPRMAGPRAYGLRICRASLGPGMPGRAILIVEPDRFPSEGGLAIVRETGGLRLLAVTMDRQGALLGYSIHPDYEVRIDTLDPKDVATVISAQFE